MDIRKIKKLIELLEESSLSEIEIVEGEESVRLARGGAGSAYPTVHGIPAHVQAAAWSAPGQPQPAPAPVPGSADTAAAEGEGVPEGELVRAPMVGTYYASPSPDAEPFVSLGQRITEGETMCIIEAMKLMNEIESPVSGIVEKILLKDGQVVEYGEILFLIREN